MKKQKSVTYCLEGVSVSQNVWERMHWAKRAEQKKYWFWMVKLHCGVMDYYPTESLQSMSIIRVARRQIDDANVAAGCKYIVDAYQEFGHIRSDARKDLRVTFDQRKCDDGEDEHMEVSLTY